MEENSNKKMQDIGISDTGQLLAVIKKADEVPWNEELMAGTTVGNCKEQKDGNGVRASQTPIFLSARHEIKEKPVAVSVYIARADTSSILWQHRRSSSPKSILPDIVEEETQDEPLCNKPGEHFEVVDLTADSEEDSRGTETQLLLATISSGDRGTMEFPPLQFCESGNTKKQSFMCVSCKKYYISVSNLQRSKDGTGIEYHCTMCPLVFNLEKSFCKHLKNHSTRHVLFCQQCKDLFGSKSFFCYMCKQEFANGTQLEIHQKKHDDQPLSCTVCARRFITESCLQEHKKICTDSKFSGIERKTFRGLPWQRLFRCQMCQEQFLTQKMLIEHRTSCSDIRPKLKYFECEICAEHFLSAEDMAAHKLSHNPQMASFACDSCGLKYLTAGGLASHKITHNKKFTSCSPSKKLFLSEPESNSNESVCQPVQINNLQVKQEVATSDKKLLPPTVTKLERQQKNNVRQRFLLPKTSMQNRKTPANTAVQHQPLPKKQLPGRKVIQHQLMPTSSAFQPHVLPGGCISQLQPMKAEVSDVPQNHQILPNSVPQYEQFVNMNQQLPPASSIAPCDNVLSTDVGKHREMPVSSGVQYQHMSTNQYQVPSDAIHSQQQQEQVAANSSYHLSTNAIHCQEIESDNSGQHQQLVGLNNMHNQQSSMYNNVHNHLSSNPVHNQQIVNGAQYNLAMNMASLPQNLSTNNSAQNVQLQLNSAVCNHQQLVNCSVQNQQWPVGNTTTQMPVNSNQYQLLPPNNDDQHQLTDISSQQTVITADDIESQNPQVPPLQQVTQMIQQQILCNAVEQQIENNVVQTPPFLTNSTTYQLLPTDSVHHQVQTNNMTENDQTSIISTQNQSLVVAQNQHGTNHVTQDHNLTTIQNEQLLNNSSTENQPLMVNSSIEQQLISNVDNSNVQNQQLLAGGGQNKILFENNIAQNQQLPDSNMVHNQQLLENDANQKQQSLENSALQNHQIPDNNPQTQQLLENNVAQSQQLVESNIRQKESRSYAQMSTDTAVQSQPIFTHGTLQNQNFTVNQHSVNGVMQSQQSTALCFPIQQHMFPANVVILQPQLPESGTFSHVASVPQQQQVPTNSMQQQHHLQQQQVPMNSMQQQHLQQHHLQQHFQQQQYLQHLQQQQQQPPLPQQQQQQQPPLPQQQQQQQQLQHKVLNSVYGHQLLPASFMYHLPANSTLTHSSSSTQLPQNIPNHHVLPANTVYQLQPPLANFGNPQLPQAIVPSQVLPINFVSQHLPGNISSQNQFSGVIPQNQQVTGIIAGNQVFPANVPNYQQVLMPNNVTPHQIFLPNGLPQQQQFSIGYPQPRVVLPNIASHHATPVKRDSTSPEKDQCCDMCCEEQKSGSGLCQHGKKLKRTSESNGIIVQFVPNFHGMHHTFVNIQAPPDNVTVVKTS